MDIDEIERNAREFPVEHDKLLSAILYVQVKNNALLKMILAELSGSMPDVSDEQSDKERELLRKADELKTTMLYDLLRRLLQSSS